MINKHMTQVCARGGIAAGGVWHQCRDAAGRPQARSRTGGTTDNVLDTKLQCLYTNLQCFRYQLTTFYTNLQRLKYQVATFEIPNYNVFDTLSRVAIRNALKCGSLVVCDINAEMLQEGRKRALEQVWGLLDLPHLGWPTDLKVDYSGSSLLWKLTAWIWKYCITPRCCRRAASALSNKFWASRADFEPRGNELQLFRYICLKNGSSPGQNMAALEQILNPENLLLCLIRVSRLFWKLTFLKVDSLGLQH